MAPGREVPTLVEVLDVVDGKLGLLIELKVPDAAREVGAVVDLLAARRISRRRCWPP
ncbi:MAG: hypothetical protein U0514_02130 [Candidatus Andersenbacteria bacterium]